MNKHIIDMLHKILSFALVCMVLPMAACQQIGKGGRIAAEDAKVEIDRTKEAFERVFTYKPKAEQYKPIPYTFCYQVLQDISCYNQPMPEARGRLVGWQGRGEFAIRDTKELPAKTALVRQPRAMETRNPIQRVLIPEKQEEPEKVSLEPVLVPVAPLAKGDGEDDKVVTIKVTDPASNTLY